MSGRFDRDLVAFVRSWAPYGGPPADEVMVEFGLTLDQLADRMQLIAATERARRFEPGVCGSRTLGVRDVT
jgi:hypothetical protein